MASVRQIVDELRRRGVTVREWPGWDGRGNEGVRYIDAKGGIIHHTGSPYGSAYAGLVVSTRPDLLGGMLCNFAGNEDGSVTVIGSGLAWHAAPATGPSLGALAPYGKSLNRNTVGLEIVYPGVSPMRPAQYRTALVFAKVVADLCAGGNIEAIRAHAEASPSGKWDPGYASGKTIDMAAFRRDAANFNPTQEDDMPFDGEDYQFMMWGPRFRYDGPNDKVGRNYAQVIHNIEDQATAANTQLAGLTAALSTLAAAVATGRDDLTAEELTAAVDEGIRRGGAAVLAAQEAARAADTPA